jgi:hypothetical protein
MTNKTKRFAELAVVWGATPKDYRGKIDGKKAILVLRDGATCLVPLTDLTDKEITRRIPKNVIIDIA